MSDQTSDYGSSRIYHFDYLRLFVIVLVILLHALLPHVKRFTWYVNEPETSGLFTLVSLVIDVFIMPTVFFIAGYFAYASLKKRGPGAFVYNKFKRIGLPAIIGGVFFVPFMTYVSTLASGKSSLGFVEYWREMYFNPVPPYGGIHLAHMWFLAMLFCFFIGFALVYKFRPGPFDSMARQQTESLGKSGAIKILGSFFALGISLFFVVSLFSPDGAWIYLFDVANFQPTRTTGYVLYFSLGIIAYLSDFTLSENHIDNLPYIGATTAVLTVTYLVFRVAFVSELARSIPFKIVNATLFVTLCFGIFVSLMVTFKKYLSRPSKPLSRLARASYSIYFFHLPIVVVLQYYMLPLALSPYVKASVVFGVSFIASYALSEVYLHAIGAVKQSIKNNVVSPASPQGNVETVFED